MVMFCTTLEEAFFRIIYMIGHNKPCWAGSPAALAASQPQLVEATVVVARYVRTWLGPHNAQLKGEFGQRDSPLMRQLTLQAAARPDVLEGVTAEVALVKLCMGHLDTLGNLGVWAHSPPDALDRLRSWGVVAYSLVPQLCGLAEALGQGPTTKQSEALCHLLRCLRSLAEMGLADEAVRAGGSRLLSVTAAAFLAHPDAERLLPDEIWFMQDVALQHPSLWVALVSGGTVAQLLGWAAAHLQKPLAWDLLIIAALVAECCAQLDALTGSATLPLLASVWQGSSGSAPQQAALGGGGSGRAGGRGGRGNRGRGRGAPLAQPAAVDGQRLHDELQQEVVRQMQGLKRSVHVFLGELNTMLEPPEPRRYSKKLPEELRTRLLRRSLWESLSTRLLPELLAVCSRAFGLQGALCRRCHEYVGRTGRLPDFPAGQRPKLQGPCCNPACRAEHTAGNWNSAPTGSGLQGTVCGRCRERFLSDGRWPDSPPRKFPPPGSLRGPCANAACGTEQAKRWDAASAGCGVEGVVCHRCRVYWDTYGRLPTRPKVELAPRGSLQAPAGTGLEGAICQRCYQAFRTTGSLPTTPNARLRRVLAGLQQHEGGAELGGS
ncbi:UPF0258 KIAA1024-like protein [Chlorella sorokiniana]|uniref:UPF0258 KIAA1024-like protein n=1 Tax=Chlorella sorokiniana TaxID=3076 RepID=A0A2P6TVC0_CHLSO|nr:UPF0258 KIAA1024-like protein [Chlorella sorokiniana]|eukprot:PRW58012.1 UPF0258 KIAA1024-like protein [Chlorella sorokiniana]